jgi:hypothetical protein
MNDDFFWPEWVEELYDKDYNEDYEDQMSYLFANEEDEEWEFLQE